MKAIEMLISILFLSLLFPNVCPQETQPPEPQTIGVLHFLDSAARSLTPLERQSAKGRAGFSGVNVELNGEKSGVRLRTDQKIEFIVRLAAGVDPNKFHLYPFEAKKGKRKLATAKSRVIFTRTGADTIPFDVAKFGESSYKLTPTHNLPVGEYGFNSSDTNEVFCFGVDAPYYRERK